MVTLSYLGYSFLRKHPNERVSFKGVSPDDGIMVESKTHTILQECGLVRHILCAITNPPFGSKLSAENKSSAGRPQLLGLISRAGQRRTEYRTRPCPLGIDGFRRAPSRLSKELK
eukprot:1189645-Prorocentrum_minimum.AAC.4